MNSASSSGHFCIFPHLVVDHIVNSYLNVSCSVYIYEKRKNLLLHNR